MPPLLEPVEPVEPVPAPVPPVPPVEPVEPPEVELELLVPPLELLSSVELNGALRKTTERRSVLIRQNNMRATCARSISTCPTSEYVQCICNAL